MTLASLPIYTVPTTDLSAEQLAHILQPAAERLRAGGLVAIPTETVYGLGANALDSTAVARIFTTKGRPPQNPLIVHAANIQTLQNLVAAWPEHAQQLAENFWPGPLTLVLPKQPVVPSLISAGLDSVAIRIPAHPIARALIELADVPVAAPSANRYTHISPTTAHHVQNDLGAYLDPATDAILDAGPTTVGIESTIVSLLGPEPRILRPGMISRDDLRRVITATDYAAGISDLDAIDETAPKLSPGLSKKHYAPRAKVIILPDTRHFYAPENPRIGWICLDSTANAPHKNRPATLFLSTNPHTYAEAFYSALHQLDDLGCDSILVEAPPRTDAWHAIWDRLNRAAS